MRFSFYELNDYGFKCSINSSVEIAQCGKFEFPRQVLVLVVPNTSWYSSFAIQGTDEMSDYVRSLVVWQILSSMMRMRKKEGRMAIPKLDAGSYTIPNSRTTIVIFTFIWMIVFMMITSVKIFSFEIQNQSFGLTKTILKS